MGEILGQWGGRGAVLCSDTLRMRPVLTNITPHLLRAMRDQSGRRAPRELLDSQGGTGSSMSCGRLEVLVVKTGPEAQRW